MNPWLIVGIVVGVLLLLGIIVVAIKARLSNVGFGEALADIFGGVGDCFGSDDDDWGGGD